MTDRVALVVLALVVGSPMTATGQLSPGHLARPHAALEGATRCTTCHAGGRAAQSANCLACHKDIAWLVGRKRGFHASEAVHTSSCASCHPDHAGESFELIQWPGGGGVERFDHDRSGWRLTGAHATTGCRDCHTAAYRVSEAARFSVRTTGAGWTGLERACVTCHRDPHRGALDRRCETCHATERWSTTPGFSHARTRYPLTGRHTTVACDRCHAAATPGGRPRYRGLAFADCSACHSDPHAGRLGSRCAACHVTESFRTMNAAGFDHERTRYPLRGAHRQAACDRCHDFSGRPGARRSPAAFATCAACHSDPHAGAATLAGKAVDCSTCHDVRAFAPATFTAAQHRDTRYPLEAGHLRVRCAACHRTSSAGAGKLVQLRPAFGQCRDCHVDPHLPANVSPRACAACHTLHGYRPSTVDVAGHARFAFALEGAHRAVPCAGCHRQPKSFTAPSRCAECHETPHGTQFATRADRGACDACHTAASWRPAGRFDHERDTRFSLAGAHAGVPCDRCHTPVSGRAGQDRRYRPLSAACESCHTGSRR